VASQEKREAIRAEREAHRDEQLAHTDAPTEGGSVSTVAKFVAPPQAEKSPLEDASTQEEIITPKPDVTTIGGDDVELHELSAKQSRALSSILQDAFLDLRETGKTTTPESLTMRAVSVIASSYNDRIMLIIASATKPAGEISDNEVKLLARTIDEILQYTELSKIIVQLMTKYLPKPSKNGAARKNG
jgi:hypothetical protein